MTFRKSLTALPWLVLPLALAPAIARAQSRHMEATGSRLDIDSSCARSVNIQPDPALSGRVVVDATAGHSEELAQLALDSGDKARLHVPAERCWEPDGGWADLPSLAITVHVPPGFALSIDEGGGVGYQIGDVGGSLALDLSGGVIMHAGGATTLDAEISGGGEVHIGKIDGRGKAEISGGGTIVLAHGAVPALDLEISGGGSFALDGGTVGKLELDLSGGGAASIGAIVGDAALQVSGGGSVHIAKVTGSLTKDVTGAGTVDIGGE